MKKRLLQFVFVLATTSILVYSGCKKMDNNTVVVPQPKPNPLEEKITASVAGRVVDENNKPVKDAVVTAGGVTVATDINGNFRLSNIQLSKNAGFVLVEKSSYFKTGRTIIAGTAAVNNIQIRLIPKTARGNFQSAAGGKITIDNGSTVDFSAAAVINKATNAAYTGQVNVFGAYLNPEDVNLPAIMPGNLTGINTAGDLKLLQTFGMMAIELEGSNGEKLNIAAGKTASITMPIPASLQASAPASIPLWYFNDTLGVWKEEGAATKQGAAYIGAVSHFSFWNCDVPNNYVKLSLTLKNQNQEPLPGYEVALINTQTNSMAGGMTDSAGMVTGPVPPSVQLQMKVYNKCHELVLTQNLGPYNTATDAGIFSVTTAPANNITVSGKVTNCNFAPVVNGLVELGIEGQVYRAIVSNGNYSITISRCNTASTSLSIIATDADQAQQSSNSSITVQSGSYTADAFACGTTPDKYLNFSIAGNTINFIRPADSVIVSYNPGGSNPPVTYINALPLTGSPNFASNRRLSMSFQGAQAIGDHPFPAFDSLLIREGQTLKYVAKNLVVNITEFGSFGGFIAGSFTGNFTDKTTNTTVSGSCTFRVRRDN